MALCVRQITRPRVRKMRGGVRQNCTIVTTAISILFNITQNANVRASKLRDRRARQNCATACAKIARPRASKLRDRVRQNCATVWHCVKNSKLRDGVRQNCATVCVKIAGPRALLAPSGVKGPAKSDRIDQKCVEIASFEAVSGRRWTGKDVFGCFSSLRTRW